VRRREAAAWNSSPTVGMGLSPTSVVGKGPQLYVASGVPICNIGLRSPTVSGNGRPQLCLARGRPPVQMWQGASSTVPRKGPSPIVPRKGPSPTVPRKGPSPVVVFGEGLQLYLAISWTVLWNWNCRTLPFCLRGNGTGMHYGSGSGIGFGSRFKIKNVKVLDVLF
jgi:hypothetical protein